MARYLRHRYEDQETEVFLIRHGATAGNLEKRYIGRTDEPLTQTACDQLQKASFPEADAVVTSPLLRCRQTAALLYPEAEVTVCDGLRETDFGRFEGKNYRELSGDADYQAWLDSSGTLPFPDGEDTFAFRDRCAAAFENVMSDPRFEGKKVAFVVHGGTIMAILERFSLPESGFYDWQTVNGTGFRCFWNGNRLIEISPLKGE